MNNPEETPSNQPPELRICPHTHNSLQFTVEGWGELDRWARLNNPTWAAARRHSDSSDMEWFDKLRHLAGELLKHNVALMARFEQEAQVRPLSLVIELTPEEMRIRQAAPVMLDALKQIAENPGRQDPEVGFMSGHIAQHAIRAATGEGWHPHWDRTLNPGSAEPVSMSMSARVTPDAESEDPA